MGTLSGGATMESARSRRQREMGDVAVCLRRGLNHTRASSTVGGTVWRAATRWCCPVERVELYLEARESSVTTAMAVCHQSSMG